MAANLWSSSHYKRLLDPEYVDAVHSLDKDRGITVEDFKLIKMHMANCLSLFLSCVFDNEFGLDSVTVELDIVKLANQVKLRQRVVATAITYMRRVYTRKSMSEYEPRLVAPTCLYLAAKAEESTVQAKVVHYYMKRIYSDEKYRYEIKDILEMEMKILEALDYYLVVFHPYHSLTDLLQDAAMGDKESIQFTWGLLNDTYKMDLILIHPPHVIALACIFIASVIKEKDTIMWFEELHVDMNAVKTISMEILDFYDSIKTNTEERITASLSKLPPRQ